MLQLPLLATVILTAIVTMQCAVQPVAQGVLLQAIALVFNADIVRTYAPFPYVHVASVDRT